MRSHVRQMAGSLCFAVGLLAPLSAQAEVDLLGTWYVLIHYKDSATNNPDVDRWLDRVWSIEKKGSRLQWTEYPIVVFQNQTGRFERYRGVRSRVLSAWEPNATQRAQIKSGLEINSRGSKSKSLRGSWKKGYKSTTRMRTQSANVIGYVENWSIEDAETNPIFTFDDMMGSGRTENLEGQTRYATLEIKQGGDLLRGQYNRDDNRAGTFQLMRAGSVARVAGKSDRVKKERQRLFLEGLERLEEEQEGGPSSSSKALKEYIDALDTSERHWLEDRLAGRPMQEWGVVIQKHFRSLPKSEQKRLAGHLEALERAFSSEN